MHPVDLDAHEERHLPVFATDPTAMARGTVPTRAKHFESDAHHHRPGGHTRRMLCRTFVAQSHRVGCLSYVPGSLQMSLKIGVADVRSLIQWQAVPARMMTMIWQGSSSARQKSSCAHGLRHESRAKVLRRHSDHLTTCSTLVSSLRPLLTHKHAVRIYSESRPRISDVCSRVHVGTVTHVC